MIFNWLRWSCKYRSNVYGKKLSEIDYNFIFEFEIVFSHQLCQFYKSILLSHSLLHSSESSVLISYRHYIDKSGQVSTRYGVIRIYPWLHKEIPSFHMVFTLSVGSSIFYLSLPVISLLSRIIELSQSDAIGGR